MRKVWESDKSRDLFTEVFLDPRKPDSFLLKGTWVKDDELFCEFYISMESLIAMANACILFNGGKDENHNC